MAEQVRQHEHGEPQPDAAGLDIRNGIGESRSVYLTRREAAIYCGRSVAGFTRWAQRVGLVSVGGTWARRDLDRARAIPRKRHVMSPHSLANLRRHGKQPTGKRSLVSADFGKAER